MLKALVLNIRHFRIKLPRLARDDEFIRLQFLEMSWSMNEEDFTGVIARRDGDLSN